MSLTAKERDILDNSNPDLQGVAIGTELYDSQSAISDAQSDITDIKAGKGITLPTSDPGVAGELWAESGTVKVSSGA